MTQSEILLEIQKMPVAERKTVIMQVAHMNLQDIIVEVTRHFKQMSPAQLLSFLNALEPLLQQDLAQLELCCPKTDQDKHLQELINASLKDYNNFKSESALPPESYKNQTQVLELVKNVELIQQYVFFDTALMLLNPTLATLKEGLSRLELDRRMAVGACITLEDYLYDKELTIFTDMNYDPILEDYD